MFTEDPTRAAFPVASHAQLVADEPNGSIGVDDPVGVTSTSNTKVAAKKFSSSASSPSPSISSSVISSSRLSSSSSTYPPPHLTPVLVPYCILPHQFNIIEYLFAIANRWEPTLGMAAD